MMGILIYAGAAFALSLTLTEFVRRWALSRGFVNRPRADRFSERTVALEGGLGFISAFLIISSVLLISSASLSPVLLQYFFALILGAIVLMALGVWDDLRTINPLVKFAIQIITAAFLTMAGARLMPGAIGVFSFSITIFFIVALTNAVNLLDNMDGVATGTVMVSLLLLLSVDLFLKPFQSLAFGCHILFLMSILGFFVLNFPPAKIFMGDAGSLPMGFLLAGLALPSPIYETGWFISLDSNVMKIWGPWSVVFVLSLVLWHPIFDTCFVIVSRLKRGQPIYVGGRDHTTHKLVEKGFSPRAVLLLYLSLSLIIGVGVLLLQRVPSAALAAFFGLFILSSIFGIFLSRPPILKESPQEEVKVGLRSSN